MVSQQYQPICNLENIYSIKGVQGDQFALLPSFLIKYEFKPIELAKSINKPLLSFIGTRDRLLFSERSKRLVSEWGGESETRIIEDANHDNIYYSPLSIYL
jgi:pimeloyl-ACP methyl ester carboxylesterase